MKHRVYSGKIARAVFANRKNLSISQDQLAFLSDLDRVYINRIELGRTNPSVKVLKKLARALKTSVCLLTDRL